MAALVLRRVLGASLRTAPATLKPSVGWRSASSNSHSALLPPPSSLPEVFAQAAQSRFLSGDLEEGIFLLGQLAATGHHPGVRELNCMLHCCVVHLQDEALADVVLGRMEKLGIVPDHRTAYLRMQVRLLQQNWKGAIDELAAARSRGEKTSQKTYTVLVDGLARAGALDLALSVVSSLPRDMRSSESLGAAMNGLIKAQQSADAIALFEKWRSDYPGGLPTVRCFNMAMEAANAQARELADSESRASRRRARSGGSGRGADASSAESGVSERREWTPERLSNYFVDLLEVMEKGGVTPNEATFDQYLRALIFAGRLDEAERVPDIMRSQGLEPSVYTYTHLLQGYARLGDFESTVAVYHSMLASGVQPTSFTLVAALRLCVNSGRMRQAAHILDKFESLGLSPDSFVFDALLDGFIRQHNESAVSKLLVAMRHSGVEMSHLTVRILSSGQLRAGKPLRAFDVLLRHLKLLSRDSFKAILYDIYSYCVSSISSATPTGSRAGTAALTAPGSMAKRGAIATFAETAAATGGSWALQLVADKAAWQDAPLPDSVTPSLQDCHEGVRRSAAAILLLDLRLFVAGSDLITRQALRAAGYQGTALHQRDAEAILSEPVASRLCAWASTAPARDPIAAPQRIAKQGRVREVSVADTSESKPSDASLA